MDMPGTINGEIFFLKEARAITEKWHIHYKPGDRIGAPLRTTGTAHHRATANSPRRDAEIARRSPLKNERCAVS